ncbi:MAG: SH3 domain-containing protein [Clostridia bacterium]|nr:SH3 domain-containing protein [Clostridia bacterium]
MKKILWILAALLVCIRFTTADAQDGFDSWLAENYGGWTVETESRWGNAGAAVIKQGDKRMLAVYRDGLGYDVPGAVADPAGRYAVHMDTETSLFFTHLFSDGSTMTCNYVYASDRWLLGSVQSVCPYKEEFREEISLVREYTMDFLDDMICCSVLLKDEEGNILYEAELPPLPDILTLEEKDLRCLEEDILLLWKRVFMEWDPDGGSVDLAVRIFDSMKRDTDYADYVCIDGRIKAAELQFLADRPDGERVLLCAGCRQEGWLFAESTPLPAGTLFGIENFADHLSLGGKPFGPSVRRYADGTWGIGAMLGGGEYGAYYTVGPHCISEDPPGRAPGCFYGDHPWTDITCIDWNSLAMTWEEALMSLDGSRCATPANPDPEDRLNLRERPDRGSASLGKFYNGTYVEVLEKGGEWTYVRIGRQVGYMMTRYLAFGEEMRSVAPAPSLIRLPAVPVAAVSLQTADGGYITENLLTSMSAGWLFIGTKEGQRCIVWDPAADGYGEVSARDFWEGNG